MKKRLFFTSAILALSLSYIGCSSDSSSSPNQQYETCKEVSDLSDFQENFGSYKADQKLPFKHSNGYSFILSVTDYKKEADQFCNENIDISLESSYPIYSINLHAVQNSLKFAHATSLDDSIAVTFGQYHFGLQNPKNDSTRIDTLIINNKIYTDVSVAKGRKVKNESRKEAYNDNYEETVKSDARLYYQFEKGILKIEMEDGTYIALNEQEKK